MAKADEKVLVEGKFNRNILAIVMLIIAIIAFSVVTYNFYWHYKVGVQRFDYASYYDSFFDYLFSAGSNNMIFYIAAVLPFLVLAILFKMMLSGCSISVSNSHVWGRSRFGKQVDLPIHQISAVSYGALGSIGVATSSGVIHFYYLKNKKEVYSTIVSLLDKEPTNDSIPTIIQQNDSSADELKKYKELLDSGVITKEEFEAKKKQLLGL